MLLCHLHGPSDDCAKVTRTLCYMCAYRSSVRLRVKCFCDVQNHAKEMVEYHSHVNVLAQVGYFTYGLKEFVCCSFAISNMHYSSTIVCNTLLTAC